MVGIKQGTSGGMAAGEINKEEYNDEKQEIGESGDGRSTLSEKS